MNESLDNQIRTLENEITALEIRHLELQTNYEHQRDNVVAFTDEKFLFDIEDAFPIAIEDADRDKAKLESFFNHRFKAVRQLVDIKWSILLIQKDIYRLHSERIELEEEKEYSNKSGGEIYKEIKFLRKSYESLKIEMCQKFEEQAKKISSLEEVIAKLLNKGDNPSTQQTINISDSSNSATVIEVTSSSEAQTKADAKMEGDPQHDMRSPMKVFIVHDGIRSQIGSERIDRLYDEEVNLQDEEANGISLEITDFSSNSRFASKREPLNETTVELIESKANESGKEKAEEKAEEKVEERRSPTTSVNNQDKKQSKTDGDFEIYGAMEKGDRIELAEEKLSLEVKELFPYLESYQPKKKIINSNLKPFIPDYIPAIGNVESFLQIPRPDNKDDGIGLKYLREPIPTMMNADADDKQEDKQENKQQDKHNEQLEDKQKEEEEEEEDLNDDKSSTCSDF